MMSTLPLVVLKKLLLQSKLFKTLLHLRIIWL
jgi:hypothetical protein